MVRAYPISHCLVIYGVGQGGHSSWWAASSLTIQMHSISPSSHLLWGLLSASHLSSNSQHGNFLTASETPGVGETLEVIAKQFSSICSNTSSDRELPTSPGSSFCFVAALRMVFFLKLSQNLLLCDFLPLALSHTAEL